MTKELDLFSGEMVVDIVVGSKYWGTDYSGSDEERFQVFLPTLESVFLGDKERSESLISEGGNTTAISTQKLLESLLKGNPQVFQYLPAIANYLHHKKEDCGVSSKLFDFVLPIYLGSAKGDWRSFINSKVLLSNKQRIKKSFSVWESTPDKFTAKDLLNLYYLTSMSKHIEAGWGWHEVISLHRMTIQCSAPLLGDYLNTIKWLKGLREFEKDFDVTEIESALEPLKEDCKNIIERTYTVSGESNGELIKTLYRDKFILPMLGA